MAKNKNCLLSILNYLYEFTDQEHQVTTGELIEHLQEQGIECSRITLKKDVDMLIDAGFDIVVNRGFKNSFFFNGRELESAEIRFLMDAVAASGSLSQKKSSELIEKLSHMVSKYEADRMTKACNAGQSIKSVNEKIWINIDTIRQAIEEAKKIRFQYTGYTADRQMYMLADGELFEGSPYALVWKEDHYYALVYMEKLGRVIPVRTDAMMRLEIIEVAATSKPVDYTLEHYCQVPFKLRDCETVMVTLRCRNERMGDIIDRFGLKAFVWKDSADWFFVKTLVGNSSEFYGWVFQFAGDVNIVSPEEVKAEYFRRAVGVVVPEIVKKEYQKSVKTILGELQ